MAKKVFKYEGKKRPKAFGLTKEFNIKVSDKEKIKNLKAKGWVEVVSKPSPKKTEKENINKGKAE